MSATSALLPSPPQTRPEVRERARARQDSTGGLDLPRGWLFEHLHAAVLVVEPSTGRVELANPAARRLFGSSAVGAAIGQLAPGLLHSSVWQRLVQHAPAEARTEHAGLEVSLSRLDRRYALAVVRQVSDRAAAALASLGVPGALRVPLASPASSPLPPSSPSSPLPPSSPLSSLPPSRPRA